MSTAEYDKNLEEVGARDKARESSDEHVASNLRYIAQHWRDTMIDTNNPNTHPPQWAAWLEEAAARLTDTPFNEFEEIVDSALLFGGSL